MPDPRRDEAGLSRLTAYLRTPRTITQIEARFSLSHRSAYRWLSYLQAAGVDIVRRDTGGRITYGAPL